MIYNIFYFCGSFAIFIATPFIYSLIFGEYTLCQNDWLEHQTLEQYSEIRRLVTDSYAETISSRGGGFKLGLCSERNLVDKQILGDLIERINFMRKIQNNIGILPQENLNEHLKSIAEIINKNNGLINDKTLFFKKINNILLIERFRAGDLDYWNQQFLTEYDQLFDRILKLLEQIPEDPFNTNGKVKVPYKYGFLKKKIYPYAFDNLNFSNETDFNWADYHHSRASSNASSTDLTIVSIESNPRSSIDSNESRGSIHLNEFIIDNNPSKFDLNAIDRLVENKSSIINDNNTDSTEFLHIAKKQKKD